jgi:hypothetical protein
MLVWADTQTQTENMWMLYAYFRFLIGSKSKTIKCLKCKTSYVHTYYPESVYEVS